MKYSFITAVICLVTVYLSSMSGAGIGGTWEFAQLMALMAEEAPEKVQYREEKHFVFLEQELVSTGMLRFLEPDTLVREVTTPGRGVYTVQGNWMVIQDEGRERLEINLADHPGPLILMETFKAILTGNLENMKKFYRVALSGKKTSWSLHLFPLDDQVQEFIESIILTGREGRVRRIEIKEVGGDYSLMTFEQHVR